MNEVLRADTTKEINKKMLALNEGYLHLAKRLLIVGDYLPNLVSEPTGIDTVINQNYVPLPSDFLGLHTIYYDNGDKYYRVPTSGVKEFDYLLEQTDGNFLDTTDIGTPSIFAVKEPNLYFDKHWDDSVTDGIKLIYHKIPETLVAYDKITLTREVFDLTIDSVFEGGTYVLIAPTGHAGDRVTVLDSDGVEFFNNGVKPTVSVANSIIITNASSSVPTFTAYETFTVGEIINQVDGATTMAYGYVLTATIVTGGTEITMLTSTRNGVFYDGYNVVGSESGATGLQSGSMEEKPQVLEISEKYKTELVDSACMKYLYFDDDAEAIAKQETLESSLSDIKDINKYDADFTIGFGK